MNIISKRSHKFLAFLLVCTLGFFSVFPEASAAPHLIFSTEVLRGTPGDSFYIDEDGSVVGGDINLNFGSGTTNQLRFNTTLSQFEFSQNVSLGGKELKNFRVENASSATCTGSSDLGTMYYDTDTHDVFFCRYNGSSYEFVPTAAVGEDYITGAMLNPAVAGKGLVQDGSGNLDVNVDGNVIIIENDTLRIGTGSITSNEIGTGAVGTDEIENGSITSTDISATAGITGSQLANDTITLTQVAERNATYIISPSFPDYTFSEDGTNNTGTMSGDFDTSSGKNYYQWSTRETGSLQDYDIVVQWHIPENFSRWQATPIEIDYKTDTTNSALNKLNLSVLDSNNTAVSITVEGGADMVSSVADTWVEDADVTFSGTPVWNAGETLVLRIKFFSRASGPADFNPAYVGQIKFNVKVK